MRPDRRRPTAANVAAAAGVSRSTVSYILNGTNRQTFSPETVARVRAAASELAYTPQADARALRRGESGVVLLALPDVPASVNFSKLVSALTDGVRAADRSLVSLALRPGNSLLDALRDMSPAALLEVLPLRERDRAAAGAAAIPVISMATSIQQLDSEAAALQVEHLAALGHRRLAVVTVSEPGTFPFAKARLRATTDTASRLGLPAPQRATVSGPPAASVPALAALLRRWTVGPDPVTAVCCFNDLIAGLVIAAAGVSGIEVPRGLSVVGIDDEPLGALLTPHLTTVRYDYTGAGEHVREQLRHVLDDGPDRATSRSGALQLVERDSTSKPAPTS
jgi:DNA-binding LacI/PurR family transcriptional regulator